MLLRKAQMLVTGKELLLTGSEGGTDSIFGGLLYRYSDACLRSGDYKLLGTVNEHVTVEDFINAIKIYALTIYYSLRQQLIIIIERTDTMQNTKIYGAAVFQNYGKLYCRIQ